MQSILRGYLPLASGLFSSSLLLLLPLLCHSTVTRRNPSEKIGGRVSLHANPATLTRYLFSNATQRGNALLFVAFGLRLTLAVLSIIGVG